MTLTLPFALLAGLGMFLFVDALRPRRTRVQLNAPDERPLMQRLLAALFAPAAERVLQVRVCSWPRCRRRWARSPACCWAWDPARWSSCSAWVSSAG